MNFKHFAWQSNNKVKMKNFVTQYKILIQLPYLFCVTVKYHSVFVKAT